MGVDAAILAERSAILGVDATILGKQAAILGVDATILAERSAILGVDAAILAEQSAMLRDRGRHLGRAGCHFWGCEPPSCGQNPPTTARRDL